MPEARRFDLSVVIVNYNVKYFLEQALLSVRNASRHLRVEVFVVDNNSVDDSNAMVREKFPEVRLIANKENVGFAKANNQAIRESSGAYVLLLNPDTVVEEDTFDRCFRYMEDHPGVGGLGVKMIDGAGKFLPESKRGFPTPFAAFCKTFGLSRLFPRSRTFNRYHLGFLDENQTHEADVLAGAFMWLRHAALDKAGLLDEAFFMYGEDIDLSYRLVLAGYRNVYFPETTIIHYKGESTKKGSLNYVKTFYQAMIIFARKHFQGRQARWFVWMLQFAIYFRAGLTVLGNGFRRASWPVLDAGLFFGGLALGKHLWAVYRFGDPGYYQDSFLYFNAPLYTALWLVGIYFSGGYDAKAPLSRILRGILWGTVLIAAIYGFLDQEYRTSRALILLGTFWALGTALGTRAIAHFLRFRNLNLGQEKSKNLVIAGSKGESVRVQGLLEKAGVHVNYIGTVAPGESADPGEYLGRSEQLEEIVRIYRVDELIFCSRDIPAGQIMQWMARLGPGVEYKIVPEESWSIIGSSSKNRSGDLYTIDIRYLIAEPRQRRNKRLFDVLITLVLILTLPVQLLIQRRSLRFLSDLAAVALGKYSWVGYCPDGGPTAALPQIRPGILHPAIRLPESLRNPATIDRLNFLYAKDYSVDMDWRILVSRFRGL
ncbi:MAG: glycosyltransferase [Haliscomenobacter sp.]|nr:glycosyltransferase [Haliscomenobacter sp.]